MNQRRTRRLLLAATGLGAIFGSSAAEATNKTWTNAAGGDFYTNANWSPSGEPGINDAAIFNLGSAGYNVAFAGSSLNPTSQRITVPQDSVGFSLGVRTYTLTSNGVTTNPSLLVGEGLVPVASLPYVSTLSLRFGQISGVHAVLGFNADTVNSRGVPGQCNLLSTTLALSGDLYAGYNGFGSLSVSSSNATMSNLWLGFNSGARGYAAVSGASSTLSAETLTVGGAGSGTLNVLGGGVIRLTDSGGRTTLGLNPGSTGVVSVDGSDSRISDDRPLFVGDRGVGTLSITNGGRVDAFTTIGAQSGSTGHANVSGAGAVLKGSITVGGSGTGMLTIGPGGSVETDFVGGQVNVGSFGEANLTGGRLTTGQLYNQGEINWSAGTIELTNMDLIIGNFGSSSPFGSALQVGTNKALNVRKDFRIGANGPGSLSILGGGHVFSGDFSGNSFINAGGQVLVTGVDSAWTARSLVVAEAGTASLTLENGGRVTIPALDAKVTTIGDAAASHGTVVVRDPISIWNNPGTFTQPGQLHIGRLGNGSLLISNGASVTNEFTHVNVGLAGNGYLSITDGGSASDTSAVIASLPGATGVVEVIGAGSTWNHAESLVIGDYGSGRLNIRDGATVNARDCYIAYSMDSIGNATVDGPGAAWISTGSYLIVGGAGIASLSVLNGGLVSANELIIADGFPSAGTLLVSGGDSSVLASELEVGRLNDGTMIISNGGSVTSDEGFISSYSGATGLVILQGAGSRWSTSTLTVGNGGPATLTINSGATLSATSELWVGSNGLLQYNGGTVSTARLELYGTGKATLSPAGDKVLKINQLVIDVANDGTLDLNDNDMIVGVSTSKAQVQAYVVNARNNGAWDMSGVTSTAARDLVQNATTLGVLSGAEYTSAGGDGTFHGVSYSGTDTLVKYTWYGDTDFNGSVDFDDYVRIDGGFNGGLTGWLNGDFDLNGGVDFDDYVLIDLGFNTQNGTLRRAVNYLSGDDRSLNGMDVDPALARVTEHFEQFGIDYATHFLAAVPEPTIVPIAAALTIIAVRRRRLPAK